MKRRNSELLRLTSTALFLALSVILSRVPFLSTYLVIGGFDLVKISFAAIPSMICALLNGPLYGLICSGGADLIAALAFPTGSIAYFPGFTFDAILFGCIPVFILKFFKGNKVTSSLVSGVIVLISAIGLYSFLPYSDEISLDGGDNFTTSTLMKIIIALVFTIIAIAIIVGTFFISKKKEDKYFLPSDVLLCFVVRDFLLKSFLAPIWLYSLYGISYSVGFITQLLTSLVTLPINLIVTYLLVIPLSNVYKSQLKLTYSKETKIYTKVYNGRVL